MSHVVVVKKDRSKEEVITGKIVISCLKSGATVQASRNITKIVEAVHEV